MKAAVIAGRLEEISLEGGEIERMELPLEISVWRELADWAAAGCGAFYCAMDTEADVLCGELLWAEKQTVRPALRLICAATTGVFPRQSGEQWRARRRELMESADEIVVFPRAAGQFQAQRYVIEQADRVLVLHDGSPESSTAFAAAYTVRKTAL